MNKEDIEELPAPKEAQEDPSGTPEEETAETGLEEASTEEASGETAEAEEAPEPTVEEEEAKPSRKKKEEDEDFVEERIYTIPLGKALARPPKKRAPRAMHMIRAFVAKHMKLIADVDDEEVKELPTLVIRNEINEKVWSRGIEKPPRKIRVRAAKDQDGNVTVHLAEKTDFQE